MFKVPVFPSYLHLFKSLPESTQLHTVKDKRNEPVNGLVAY